MPLAPQVGVPPLQIKQALPSIPQAPSAVPSAHEPALQHPPLQAVICTPPQLVPHPWVVVLHA